MDVLLVPCQPFTTQVLEDPITSNSESGPLKSNLLKRLSEAQDYISHWTTFPRVPRDSRAGALGSASFSFPEALRSLPSLPFHSIFPRRVAGGAAAIRLVCLCRSRLDSWPRSCVSTGGWYWSPARGEVSTRKPESGRPPSCGARSPPSRPGLHAQPQLQSRRRGCGR